MKIFALVIGILLLFAGVANAGQHIDSATVDLTKTDWMRTIQLDKFDPSWGTLTSITFQISGLVDGNCGVVNTGNMAYKFIMGYTGTLTLDKLGGSTLVSSSGSCSQTDTIDPSGSASYDMNTNVPLKSEVITSNFADFLGTGKMDLNMSAVAAAETKGPGNVDYSFITYAQATATVIYDYTTPEPGSIVALCTGLAGIAGLALRRRK